MTAPTVEPFNCPQSGISGHFITLGPHAAFVDRHGVVTVTGVEVYSLSEARQLADVLAAAIALAEQHASPPAPTLHAV